MAKDEIEEVESDAGTASGVELWLFLKPCKIEAQSISLKKDPMRPCPIVASLRGSPRRQNEPQPVMALNCSCSLLIDRDIRCTAS
jgi:hypothetical protein